MGWIATVLTGLGVWLIGYKLRWAFLILAAGDAAWMVKAVATNQWDLIAISTLMLILAMRNWWMWRDAGSTVDLHSNADIP